MPTTSIGASAPELTDLDQARQKAKAKAKPPSKLEQKRAAAAEKKRKAEEAAAAKAAAEAEAARIAALPVRDGVKLAANLWFYHRGLGVEVAPPCARHGFYLYFSLSLSSYTRTNAHALDFDQVPPHSLRIRIACMVKGDIGNQLVQVVTVLPCDKAYG